MAARVVAAARAAAVWVAAARAVAVWVAAARAQGSHRGHTLTLGVGLEGIT